MFVSVDISRDYPFVKKCLHNLEVELGPIYILFSCAGTAICGTVEQLSIEDANVSESSFWIYDNLPMMI